MTQIELSMETFRELVRLKNHWSYHFRHVTNPEVQKAIDEKKLDIFGYDTHTPHPEIERISNTKSRDQLEAEMEAFARVLTELLVSGYDFEPGFSFDELIQKMVEIIEDGEDIAAPMF
jgi:hypothetical protein